MTWTILELNRNPPPERCCYLCNPNLASPFAAANPRDPRLLTFANDFKYGLTVPISRPGSSASIRTDVSNASSFIPVRPGVKVPQEEQEKLREKLINWRNQKHQLRGSPLFLSAQTILPPKQLNAFVSQSNRFLQEEIVTICLLRKLVPWDSATETDLAEIVSIISNWRDTATIAFRALRLHSAELERKEDRDQNLQIFTLRERLQLNSQHLLLGSAYLVQEKKLL